MTVLANNATGLGRIDTVVKRIAVVSAFGFIVLICMAGSLYLGRASTIEAYHAEDYHAAFLGCIDETFRRIAPTQTGFAQYRDVWITCGNQIYDTDLLKDFDIRRDKLVRQGLDERVTLWMVVAITLSGVLLAGVQLFASYRLTSGGLSNIGPNDTVLTIEQVGKVTIRSSVTGLIILIVSLAFFVVYVKWIYTIKEVPIEKPANLGMNVQPYPTTAYGHLGPPEPASLQTLPKSLPDIAVGK